MRNTQVLNGILTLLFTVTSLYSLAQFSAATIGIDGMVCSACSLGTEKSIRKLSFVNDVVIDLNKNIAIVSFKKDAEISMNALAQKVYDAGFSVRSLEATFNFTSQTHSINCFYDNGITYQFIDTADKILCGEIKLKFIGDKFVPKKDLRKWKAIINKTEACNKSDIKEFYFVTL